MYPSLINVSVKFRQFLPIYSKVVRQYRRRSGNLQTGKETGTPENAQWLSNPITVKRPELLDTVWYWTISSHLPGHYLAKCVKQTPKWGTTFPFPSPLLPSLPSPPLPSLPTLPPPLPSPPLPLEVGPVNPARGSGGALLAPPVGVWSGAPAEIEFSAF